MSEKEEHDYTIDNKKVYERHLLALKGNKSGLSNRFSVMSNMMQDIMRVDTVISNHENSNNHQPTPGDSRASKFVKVLEKSNQHSSESRKTTDSQRPSGPENIYLQHANKDAARDKLMDTGGIEKAPEDHLPQTYGNEELDEIQTDLEVRNVRNVYKMMKQHVDAEVEKGRQPRGISPYLDYAMDKLQIPKPNSVEIESSSRSSQNSVIIE